MFDEWTYKNKIWVTIAIGIIMVILFLTYFYTKNSNEIIELPYVLHDPFNFWLYGKMP